MKILYDANHMEADREPGERACESTPRYWRSFDELAQTESFQSLVDNEFPRYAPSEWTDDKSRRTFLKLSGASVALAGLTACTRQPAELIVPYVEQPEDMVLGQPTYYSTVMPLAGYAEPLVAKSREGRPIKLNGNPEHPASLGGTNAQAQASLLDLYDPDRSKAIERLGRIQPWQTFTSAMRAPLSAQEAIGGEGLRILTPTSTSPTVERLMNAVRARFPRSRWVQYEQLNRDIEREAARLAFGRDADVRYDFSRADVVLTLDADFLNSGPGHLRYAKDFAKKRSVRDGKRAMNRLYAVETSPSGTGAMADHQRPASASELAAFTLNLAARLGIGSDSPDLSAPLATFLDAVVADLDAHHGSSAVVPGRFASPEIHVLAHAVNAALHNLGNTVLVTDPVALEPADQGAALAELAREMQDGGVDALFILGSNPVFEAPADIDFAAALGQVELTVHLGLHRDETAEKCEWHLSQSHYLEGWGDARAFDGTTSAIQPLIRPLYDSKTDIEILSLLAGIEAGDYDLVETTWRSRGMGTAGWRRLLHDGYLRGSEVAPVAVELNASAAAEAAAALVRTLGPTSAVGSDQEGASEALVEVHFRPDPSILDGRFANNGWLQELPKTITLLTWDNAAILSPGTAQELGLQTNDVVWLEKEGRRIDLPVLVQPGQAAGTVTVYLGHGRVRGGRIANGVGTNANLLRTSNNPWLESGVKLTRSGRQHRLATTQSHFVIADLEFELEDYEIEEEQVRERHLIKQATLEHYVEHPDFVEHQGHIPNEKYTSFGPWPYEGYSWGMAIDLTACTGCNACIVACVAENNIPVVGREQVINGREMQWLRIDRYFEGPIDAPRIHHQPLTCMHCENAPCEVVCPVGATVHGHEGLNEMVYNRCVGTRYCANNCPYKVRRFNFLAYTDHKTPVLEMSRNPEVTVRSRGVMEKCTYCVQRINSARAEAKRQDRRIRDGEVRTACQEVCPSDAIVFGDLNDESSAVVAWKAESRDYALIPDLNTLPRTTYLARITNPNATLAEHEPFGHAEPEAAAHAPSEETH